MLERISRPALVDLLQILLLSSICLVLGLKSLEDLDLGWHLAGGLWMLDHGSVPRADFLGALGSPWVAYSWLPEAVLAVCFRLFGFRGLVLLQFIEVLGSAAALYASLIALTRECFRERPVQTRLLCACACLLLMQLLTPFWALRPQLLSAMAFCLVLVWAETGRLRLFRAAVLTIVWANVHVFWIAVPVVMGIYTAFEKKGRALSRLIRASGVFSVLVLCGAISPYGFRNLEVLRDYAVHHKDAYGLIREFQPLSFDLGYVVGVFGLAIVVPFAFRRRLKDVGVSLWIVWIGALCASLLQRKYLLFFGPVSCAMFARTCIPAIAEWLPIETKPASRRTQFALTVVAVVFFGIVLTSIERVAPLGQNVQPLLKASEVLSKRELQGQVHVLSSFDDGGWLGLGLYLNRRPGLESSAFRTSIDGRTLVMGGELLHDYSLLEQGSPQSCDILSRWRVTALVLRRGFPLLDDFLEHLEDKKFRFACLERWQLSGSVTAGPSEVLVALPNDGAL